jgi:hypothetical protein
MELTTDSPKMFESAREVIGYSMAKQCANKGKIFYNLVYEKSGVKPS